MKFWSCNKNVNNGRFLKRQKVMSQFVFSYFLYFILFQKENNKKFEINNEWENQESESPLRSATKLN